jgi:tetratricopeptide (TPR) repeat protein
MTDEMSPKIKAFFDLTESQIMSDKAVSIAESMTSSPEALIHYNESLRLRGVFRWKDAAVSMQKAVSLDPEFAMAHLMISHWHLNEEESRASLMKAVELKERASDWEQKFIDGYFLYRDSDYLKAMESLEEVLERVPEHRLSLETIARIYFQIGEIELAIKFMEKYNEYYPDDERAGIYILSRFYMFAGYFDKAKELLERYPEDLSGQMPNSLISCYVEMGAWDLAIPLAVKYYEKIRNVRHLRGNIYFFQDDFASAEAEYEKLGKEVNKNFFRLDFIPLVQGRYKEAAERFLANIEELRKEEEISEDLRTYVACLSHIYIQMGQPEKALDVIEAALDIDETPEFLFWKGWAQINLGSLSEALLTAEKIKRLVEQSLFKGNMRFYYLLMALIEKQNRNYDKAIDFCQRALAITYFWGRYYRNLYVDTLASLYFLKNDLEKAKIEYEKSISLTEARFNLGDIYAKSYYMLGKIHQQQGKKAKAKEYYEKFLDLWKKADHGLPEVDDAKARLSSL